MYKFNLSYAWMNVWKDVSTQKWSGRQGRDRDPSHFVCILLMYLALFLSKYMQYS
jgi:hypothetical protein